MDPDQVPGYFYPRSPCGERQEKVYRRTVSLTFLSTLSLRRATLSQTIPASSIINFYPRSPCGERQEAARDKGKVEKNFYPRSPCGERLLPGYKSFRNCIFLSTLSLRRATVIFCKLLHGCIISIHALLAESDSKSAQNSGALLRIWNKFYGDCIFMLTGKAVFYPFCPCFFHIFWCEGSGNFMIAFPSH